MKKILLILLVLLIPSCSQDNLKSEKKVEELSNQVEYHFNIEDKDIQYDEQVKEEDKLMVTLKEYRLCQSVGVDHHLNLVLEGSLVKIIETASINYDGELIKWYRVEAPQYDNFEGWIPEHYLEYFDSSDTSKVINVKCIGPVTVYLDDNNELGAKSTIITSFQGIILDEKDKYVKISLGHGPQLWINKYDIVLHFEDLIN